MGSQQLLLIGVGVVILGVMVAIGLTMFADQAASTNRDELVDDLAHYATIVRGYYRRPATFGGGGSSFRGLTMSRITSEPINMNGTYSLSPDPAGSGITHVTLTGVGTELGLDGTNKVKVIMLVYADSAVVDQASMN